MTRRIRGDERIGYSFLASLRSPCWPRVACQSSPGRPGRIEGDPAGPDSGFQRSLCAELRRMPWPDGKGGAAIPLGDPVFLAIADDAAIRRTAANGVPGTPMPAFAQSAGGMLTDKQIDAIVGGIRSWAKPESLQRRQSCRPMRRRHPAIRSAAPTCMRRTAPPATARTAAEAQGQFHCEWLISRPGERSESAHHRHHGTA